MEEEENIKGGMVKFINYGNKVKVIIASTAMSVNSEAGYSCRYNYRVVKDTVFRYS